MTDQEFESLYAQLNRPSLGGRLLQGLANVPSSILQGTADAATGFLNLGLEDQDKLPSISQYIPQPFDIPQAQNWQETGVDIIPNIVSLLPQILVPEIGATRLLAGAGMAPRAASIIGAALGNAVPGLQESGVEAAGLGGIGAAQRATDFLPRSARLPLSLLAGGAAGALDYAHSGDAAQSGAIGVLNAALPFLPRQIDLPSQSIRPTIKQPQLEYGNRAPQNIYHPETGEWAGTGALPMYGTPYGERAVGGEFQPPMYGPAVAGDVTFDFESMRVPPVRRIGDEGLPAAGRFAPQEPVEAEFVDFPLQRALPKSPTAPDYLPGELGGISPNEFATLQNRGLSEAERRLVPWAEPIFEPVPQWMGLGKQPPDVADVFGRDLIELPGQVAARPDVQIEQVTRNVRGETPSLSEPTAKAVGRSPKITKDDYDILDKFTDKNRLRVVPEGKEGVVVFESLQDVPKVGKVRIEVPEGTTVAQANKMLKEARKGKIATLQKPLVEGEGTVPFADVPSKDIDIRGIGEEIQPGTGIEKGSREIDLVDPKTGMKRRVNMDKLGRAQQELLQTIASGGLGAAFGMSRDDEDRLRGFVMGGLAGLALPQAIRTLKNPRTAIESSRKQGIFAGSSASGYKKAEAEGRLFKGLDDKLRFEISDLPVKFKLPSGALGEFRIDEVIDHPELFENYPTLKNVKVVLEKMPHDIRGKVDEAGNIHLNSDLGDKQNFSSLIHEIQHKIQRKEGFARGGSAAEYDKENSKAALEYVNYSIRRLYQERSKYNPQQYKQELDALIQSKSNLEREIRAGSGDEYYQRLAGEIEAREVQSRQALREFGYDPGRPFMEVNRDEVINKFRSTQEFDQARSAKMKQFTQGGFIEGEVLRLLGSTIGGGLIGGYMDKEYPVRGMVLGAMLGGGLSKYGPELLDWMTAARGGLKGKGFTELAKEAALGAQGTMPKLARNIEKLFTSDPKIRDLVSKAGGETALAAEQIGDSLNVLRSMKLSDTDNRGILDFFTSGNIATLQKQVSNVDAQAAAITARQVATKLQQMLTEGMNDTKLRSKIEGSFDKYLTRAYKIFHDPKYQPSEVQIDAVAQELQRAFPTMGADIAKAKVRDYVHEVLTDRALLKTAKAAYSGSRTTTGQSLGEILLHRKDLRNRPAFRDLLGEYTNPVEMMAATASKLIPAARAAKFFDDVADTSTATGNKFTYSQDEWQKSLDALRRGNQDFATLQKIKELEGYVPVGESERYGKLSNRMVHRRVRDQLSTYDSPWGLAENNVIKGMVDLHTLIKTGRTVLNPITVLRNILTVPFFSAIADAGGPGHWKEAYKIIRAKGKEYEEMMRNGILSADQVKGEFYKDIGMVLKGNPDAKLAERIFSGGLDKAMEFYRLPDLVVRGSSYLRAKAKYLKQGMSEQDAIDAAVNWVNRYTMNYDQIVPGIRAARQLPFANIFLSYTSEIMRIAKNLGMDALGKGNQENQIKAMALLAGIPTMFAGAQFVSEQALSKQDQEEWSRVKSLMPANTRNNFMLVSGRMSDGSFKYYNISPLFIADDWGKMFRGVISGDTEAVAANNPFVGWENTPLFNVISEQVSGRDKRTGQKIDGIVARLDEVRKEILPPLLGGYALDNVAKALTPNERGEVGITDPVSGRRYNWQTILNEFGISAIPGARTSFINPDYQKRAAMFMAQEKIQVLQSQMRQIQRSDASQEVKDGKRERTQKEIESILNELKTKIGQPEEAAF